MELRNGEIRKGVLLIKSKDAEHIKKRIGLFQKDPGLRAVVIDLGVQESAEALDQPLFSLISNYPVPVITAVEGNVKGWALGVVLASHICYAAESTVFDFEGCGSGNLYTNIENNDESRGRIVSAESMLAMGEVNGLFRPDRLISLACETAIEISRMAPLAIRACLESINRYQLSTIEKGLASEALLFSRLFETKDMRRGTKAFFEKTEPCFEGN